jgi:hypothetical protein
MSRRNQRDKCLRRALAVEHLEPRRLLSGDAQIIGAYLQNAAGFWIAAPVYGEQFEVHVRWSRRLMRILWTGSLSRAC